MRDWVFIAIYTVITTIFIAISVTMYFSNLAQRDQYDRWVEACVERGGSIMEWDNGRDTCINHNKQTEVPGYEEFQVNGI